MLDAQSLGKNVALLLLSWSLLPLDTLFLCFSYVLRLIPCSPARRANDHSLRFAPKTVLVTGVGNAEGLTLARIFYRAGHRVIGGNFKRNGLPVPGRFSRALSAFYSLSEPDAENGSAFYIRDLLEIIRVQKADLWINCSGVALTVEDGQAKEIIERRSDCKVIHFDHKTVEAIHEQNSFIQHTTKLGLNSLETYIVTSRASVHSILNRTNAKRYTMKQVGTDHIMRRDSTLLPKSTLSATYQYVSKIPISPGNPWLLQEYIQGEEYSTYAVVVRGEVKAFVACPSPEPLICYEGLRRQSSLGEAMLKFTREFAARSGNSMTGRLSFSFLVEETVTEKGLEVVLYPTACNSRAHAAMVLFSGEHTRMARAYMSALALPEVNGTMEGHGNDIIRPERPRGCYWIGHDLVALVLWPFVQLILLQGSMAEVTKNLAVFAHRLLFWKEGVFAWWDPLPWWWLYHVYWPGQLLFCMIQQTGWSRIDVSTGTMHA